MALSVFLVLDTRNCQTAILATIARDPVRAADAKDAVEDARSPVVSMNGVEREEPSWVFIGCVLAINRPTKSSSQSRLWSHSLGSRMWGRLWKSLRLCLPWLSVAHRTHQGDEGIAALVADVAPVPPTHAERTEPF